MGFFNKIKRALGFTPDGEDVDELDIYEMSNHTPYENPFARRTEDKQVETAASDAAPEKPAPVAPQATEDSPIEPPVAEVPSKQPAAQQPKQPQPATAATTDSELMTQLKGLLDTYRAEAQQPSILEEQLNTVRQRLAESEDGRRAAQSRANDLSVQNSQLTTRVEQLTLDKTSLEEKIARNEQLVNSSEQMLQQLTEAQEKLEAMEALRTQVEQLTEASRLHDEADEERQRQQDLRDRQQADEQRLLQQKLELATQQIADLEQQLEEALTASEHCRRKPRPPSSNSKSNSMRPPSRATIHSTTCFV